MSQVHDATMQTLQFTSDWWTRKIPNWTRYIVPLFHDRPTSALEVGSYEGRSTLWLLDNVLRHPRSSLACVDRWADVVIEARFDYNVLHAGIASRVQKIKGEAFDALRRIESPLDLVYLDADHRSSATLAQTVLVWPRLRHGGVLVWDDYGWHRGEDGLPDATPAKGIDAFLRIWDGQYDILWKSYQIAIRKR